MADPTPILMQAIPDQVINAGAAYGPFDLNAFFQFPPESENIRFIAELSTGAALPKGLICTSEGMLTGIPAKGTEGSYGIVVIIEVDGVAALTTQFNFTIKSRIASEGDNFFSNFKTQIWGALAQDLPIPDLSFFDRPITADEINYLLQRWAALTILDTHNLNARTEKKLLQLEGASKHYNIYDCGNCLIGAPKDLYSYERTTADALQTARVMAREVYNRGWSIEIKTFDDRMERVAMDELHQLGEQHGKHLEIMPSPKAGS